MNTAWLCPTGEDIACHLNSASFRLFHCFYSLLQAIWHCFTLLFVVLLCCRLDQVFQFVFFLACSKLLCFPPAFPVCSIFFPSCSILFQTILCSSMFRAVPLSSIYFSACSKLFHFVSACSKPIRCIPSCSCLFVLALFYFVSTFSIKFLAVLGCSRLFQAVPHCSSLFLAFSPCATLIPLFHVVPLCSTLYTYIPRITEHVTSNLMDFAFLIHSCRKQIFRAYTGNDVGLVTGI